MLHLNKEEQKSYWFLTVFSAGVFVHTLPESEISHLQGLHGKEKNNTEQTQREQIQHRLAFCEFSQLS